ncbi:MAG TPA: polyphosphate kinase 1 [Solirubrobacterales bacterium]|nr:polyphosphate kinase 1 [Solirubrobacterales bacterium]
METDQSDRVDGGEAPPPASPPAEGALSAATADLEDPALYFNRQTSWMDFNDRVLQLVEDPSIPLLERIKFCAIYESNLDEFFMVRVAGLHDQVEASLDGRGADGMSASEQINAVREKVLEQRARLQRCFDEELRPALGEYGIRIISYEEASSDDRRELDLLFRKQVFPALTPLVLGMGRPFPYISNLSLSLLVVLRDPEQDGDILARVKVPKELLRRFVPLADGISFVAMEEVIARNLGALFPGMEVIGHSLFRVTRDTDYDVSDEADDLRQAVEDEIRRRRFGEIVRLEISASLPDRLRDRLISSLKIEDRQVYPVVGMLGMDDLWDVVGVPGFPELRDEPFTGVTQPRLQGEDGDTVDILAAMREGDIVVHHPYDAFSTSVEAFIKQATNDPDVLAIKQTVYRTSADSPLIRSLIDAAERGKQAVCMVELKARFDEQANITWAKRLEQSGVHVVYGIPALKTHAKCALIARREGDGVRHYAHIGTGNYNAKTAKLYTDLGIFTADPDLCSDIAEMFNYLTGYARPRRYRRALIAPHNLAEGLLDEIDRTIESHSPETPARIRMKMNSLLDPPMIRALYRASQAGVPVELNVRGICALRPGVPGVSESVSVVSVLGRFLEHSRIYAFERAGEEPSVYIGSADLMPRNLYNRVELIAPVIDDRIRADLLDILDVSLAAEVGAWELDAGGHWTRRTLPEDRPGRDVQAEFIERYNNRLAESVAL